MDQNTQQFMNELQEFVHKAQKFLQESGGNYGQRGFYGMRDGQGSSSGYSGYSGNSGGYGQREPWMQHGMQGQNWQQGGGQMPYIDPRYFM